ncbi:MAG TPA: hypothetical protein PKE69_02845 [Pyrinomonadaceae bacterium]|nr:hypothetical protein [Pyrinomonadaceae bacterium]
MSLRIKYTKTILRGLRYCSLPKLINRKIEICSLETFEADLFAILGGDLPPDSRLISPERIYLEGAIVKYGLIDATLSVSNRHLASCSIINGNTLRELGFVLSPEDKDYVTENALETGIEDVGLLDFLAKDVEKNEAIIKLFLKAAEEKPSRLSLKLSDNYFPRTFVVEDACLTNSGYVWFNKHFYL